VESRLDIMLELVELEYMLRPVRTMIIRDADTIEIDGLKVELKKGVETELPYWLARQLASKDMAKLIETPISLEDIARLHFSVISAKTPSDLEPLPQYFYQEAKTVIQDLEERARKELNPALFEESQKMMQYLVDIIDKRLTMILQSLRSPTTIAELSSRLAPEEATLLSHLNTVLRKWKEKVLPRHQRFGDNDEP